MEKLRIQNSQVALKRCDECGKAFDLNDGEVHYYDAQMEIYLCSNRCLYDSFFEQVGDITVDYILNHPEYNVIKLNQKKAGIA